MANKTFKSLTPQGLDITYKVPATAPEYAATNTYAVGDLAVYQGVLYKCTTAIDTPEAWTVQHWQDTTIGDEVSTLKESIETEIALDISHSHNAYPTATIGERMYFRNSEFTTSFDRCMRVIKGQPYSILFNNGAEPASVNERKHVVINDNGLVQQAIPYTNTGTEEIETTFIAAADGWLVLSLDANYASVKVIGNSTIGELSLLKASNSILENDYTSELTSIDFELGKWLKSTGVVSNSWVSTSKQPINNIGDVAVLNDTTGGHLWIGFDALDSDWNYVGRWNPESKEFVPDGSSRIYRTYNFEEIKTKYPDYHLFLLLAKDDGTITAEQTMCVSLLRKIDKNLVVVDGDKIEWAAGQCIYNTGVIGTHENAISTVDFIPNSYKYLMSGNSCRVHLWSKGNAYLGIYQFPKTLVNTSPTYSIAINLEEIRKLVPGCKLKVVAYGMDSDPAKAKNIKLLQNSIEAQSEANTGIYDYRFPKDFILSQLTSTPKQTNHRPQGFGTDGTYLYWAEITDVDAEETAETIIHKIDPTDGTEVATSSGLVLGHANCIGYDPNNNYLLVTWTIPSNRNLMYRIDAETLTLVDTIDLSPFVSFFNVTASGVAYAEEGDCFILYTVNGYSIVDSTFTNVIRYIKRHPNGPLVGQNVVVYDSMIVQSYWSQPDSYYIYYYDFHGNVIGKTKFNNHLQGTVFIGNKPYFLVEGNNIIIYSGETVGYGYVSPEELQKQLNFNY